MICYGLPAYISNWMTGSVLESSTLMNPKQMTLTSSTRTLMPSTSSRCFQETSYSDQLDVVVADQVQQETFHGLHFLLGKTSPSCSLLFMKACKVELLMTARKSSRTVFKS